MALTGRRWLVATALLAGLASLAQAAPLVNPIPAPIRRSALRVKLETVATGLTSPVWATAAPGDASRLFVADQAGTLWAVVLATGAKSVFLDVSARLVPLGAFGPGSYDERGFLGVAFHASFATNGLLYTYTSEPVAGAADYSTLPVGDVADHQSVVTEWHVANPTNPLSVVDPGSARVLLRVDKPQFNHNGGALVFGPDGMLYVSVGDGGGADDQDGDLSLGPPTVGHGATGNGQNPASVLGKILRIDPRGASSANGRYGIPGDNPFVARAGFAPEIFALGFRNPFRFSFDRASRALYAGDVGQNSVEEVDVVVAGGNYGWRLKEGAFFFDPNGTGPGFVTATDPGVPPGLIDPVAQYDHGEGIAVIGGFVYRGSRNRALRGHYVFGELARTFSNDGRLFVLKTKDVVRKTRILKSSIGELRLVGRDSLGLSLLGFGEDAAGEIYVLANSTGVPSGSTGVVLRIAPPMP